MVKRDIDLIINDETKDSATVDSRPGGEATATLSWDTSGDGDGTFTARVELDDGLAEDAETVEITSLEPNLLVAGGSSVAFGDPDLVEAFDPDDQSTEWTYTAPDNVQSAIPAPDGDVIYAGDSAGNVISLSPSDGSENWSEDIDGSTVWSTIASADGTVVFVGTDTKAYAIDPSDQSEIWSVGNSACYSLVPGSDGGTVFGGFGSSDYLKAFDAADGSEVWSSADPSGNIYWIAPGPDGGTIFTSEAEIQRAIDASDGSQIWQANPWSTGAGRSYGAVDSGGGTFYAAQYDEVKAFDASDGSVQWTSTINDPAAQSVWFSGDDSELYVGDQDRNIIAFDPSDGSTLWTKSLSDITPNSVAARPNTTHPPK